MISRTALHLSCLGDSATREIEEAFLTLDPDEASSKTSAGHAGWAAAHVVTSLRERLGLASIDALERLTPALEWDPFELPLREQDTVPEGVRTLLLAELTHMQHLVQTAISWVQTLDAAMARRAAQPDTTPNPATWPDDLPPTPRPRGRPGGTRTLPTADGEDSGDSDE